MQIFQEGMKTCYVLEPLVKQRLSHSLNLGIAFLQEQHLKMTCMEEDVALIPIQDGSTSIARLVDRGCHSFMNPHKSGGSS